jgi:hypothetical protein
MNPATCVDLDGENQSEEEKSQNVMRVWLGRVDGMQRIDQQLRSRDEVVRA